VTRAVRTVTDADVPAIVVLVNEATPEIPVDDAEVRTWLSSPEEEMHFALVVGEQDELLAYADLFGVDRASGRIWLDLRVCSQNDDDETVAAALDWAEAIVRERGLRVLRVFAKPESRVPAFLEASGYRRIRHSFRMRIDLAGPPPEPVWPAGIDVQSLRPGEERAVFEAVEDAFADHWEWRSGVFEEWAHFMVDAPDFDPSLWLIARDAAELAGVCICRRAPGEPELGWVRQLGVRPPWRRRGLGEALLVASFGLFWERGMRAVGLGVDGENTTGAVRLYERAGMRVAHRFDSYEKEIP
jgi:mycothiol synthase